MPSSKSYKETNTSSAWYLQIFSFLSSSGMALKEILGQIPEMFYPDNPAKDSLFPYINSASALSFLTYLTPVALVLNITNTWESIKKFYYAENKNWEKCLDLTIKILNTGAAATYLGLALFGGVSLVLTVAPYLLLAAAGIGVVYGLFNIGKRIYRAYKNTDKTKSKGTTFERVKQFGSVVISSLAATVTYYLGIEVNSEFSHLNGGIFHDLGILKNVGEIFKTSIPFIYSFAIAAAVGVILSVPAIAKAAWKLNNETLSTIKNVVTDPVGTAKKAGSEFLNKCDSLWRFVKKTNYIALPFMIVPIALEITRVTVVTALRIPALILHPAVYLIHKIRSRFERKDTAVDKEVVAKAKCFSVKDILSRLNAAAPQPRTKKEIVRKMTVMAPVSNRTDLTARTAEQDYTYLQYRMCLKIEQLEKYGTGISDKDNAKLILIRNIRSHFEAGDLTVTMVDQFVKDAKKISCRVFQSFWREVGEVEEVVRDVKKYILGKAMEVHSTDLTPVVTPLPLPTAVPL